MQLLPAIDIRDGRCVRLKFGDFDQETRYDVDPVELAGTYASLGASWLHVVDLDGAARGEPVNLDLIAAMQTHARLRVQLGGGIRTRDSLERTLAVAERVVIGSLVVSEPETVDDWVSRFGGERFTLALDVRLTDDATPVVTTHGWQRDSEVTLWEALERYRERRIRHVLCTDVGRDGAMLGPNLELYAECLERWPGVEFQASGGVRNVADLEALHSLGMPRAVVGKALLEGRISGEEMRSFLPSE